MSVEGERNANKRGHTMRPFYFMVPFWGERYRNYFVDFCLASMLAPKNLGLLRAADGHRFLVATTREDWQAIERLPIMKRLCAHATPVFVEIPNQNTLPGGTATIWHQNACQRVLIEMAFRDRVYGCLLFPDVIVSDGMVESLRRSIAAGHRAVLCTALRQTQESMLAELTARGYLPADSRPALTGDAIVVPPRVLAELAIRHLHWEVAVFDENSLAQPYMAPFRFWRIAGGRGIIIHCFHSNSVMMDYGAIETHNTTCLDQDILENVYIERNFAPGGNVHVVDDSDEFGMLSLTPVAVGQRHAAGWKQTLPWSWGWRWPNEILQRCSIREAMALYARRNRDTTRRDLFLRPLRWHIGDIDDVWRNQEQQIEESMANAVGDYAQCAKIASDKFPRLPSGNPRYLLIDVFGWILAHEGLGKALRGDLNEWARMGHRFIEIVGACSKILMKAVRRIP